MSGIEIIAAERARQVSDEGWSAEHDDKHTGGELALAGALYATAAEAGEPTPAAWPWDARWWKPKDHRITNLARAGALIAAEIDRLQRANGS